MDVYKRVNLYLILLTVQVKTNTFITFINGAPIKITPLLRASCSYERANIKVGHLGN